MMHPPVAPQHHYRHHRYRAENHRQPRSSEELAATCNNMEPPSDSEQCITQTLRQPAVTELRPSEEWAPPEAGTTSESDDQAATTVDEARRPAAEPAAVEAAANRKKDRRSAEDAAGGGSFDVVEPAGAESARERLKRHRTEMAGRVRIPDMWGQERLLKDWVVDCAVFDRPLAATAGLLNARAALVAECAAARRPAHGSTRRPLRLRVRNGCS